MILVLWIENVFSHDSGRPLNKLYFQKSTVLVQFLKKGVMRNF